MRKSFNFYASYFEIANELNDIDRLSFYDAIICYQLSGNANKLESLKGMAKFAYISQKHSIETQVKGHIDKSNSLNNRPFTGYINTEKILPLIDPIQGGVVDPLPQLKVQSTITSTIESKNTTVTFDFKKSLLSLGANESLINDWLLVRKKKKATNTENAFNSFVKELKLSNLPIDTVLEKCISRNWLGFEASWVKPEILTQQPITKIPPQNNFSKKAL
jgi:hypothetical protein